jgi:isoquinoline 1-oxidoreductase beta subunit
MSDALLMRRRTFLSGLGLAAGGLAFGLFDRQAYGLGKEPPIAGKGFAPNVFVHVAPDGLVTLVCHRSEMGQGIRSTLPALFADELGADLARVKIAQADGDPIYGDQNTDGSSSIRNRYPEYRSIAATARVLLVAAAAQRWRVAPASCEALHHTVVHKPTKRTLGFGELADAAAKLPLPKLADVPLRPRRELEHTFVPGMALVDGPDIVTGRAQYGADVKLPGMLVAVIARPPVVGGQAVRYDDKRALAIAGVRRVLQLPNPKAPWAFQPLGGLAVLADNTWAALRGRQALDITWADGDNGAYDSVAYRQSLLATVRQPGKIVRHTGDVDAALASAARTVQAEYYVPHLAHAPMEPPAALARYENGRCEIWTSTQNPQAARKEAARALGIDEAHVTVHVTLLGGAFGRKSKADFVSEAALLARAAGVPVRVQWTREDDIQHDYYHAVSAQQLTAALDKSGKVTGWRQRTAFPPIPSTFTGTATPSEGELQQGVLDLPLAIANVRAESGDAKAHARIGWLRSVCNIFHAFAAGSFMDELAHERGRDPKQNLLELFGPPRIVTPVELGVPKVPNYGASLEQHPIDVGRLRHVIERAAALSGWDERRQRGRALGLAAHRSFLTYVAAVMSVGRDARGKLHVDEAWIVADAGTIVNPDRARAMMEGAVIFGMSLAFYGAVTMRKGAVEQTNFRDYKLVRMAEAPRKIHVELVASDGPPGGVGEPGVPPVAPALANAIFALTGQRIRELPLARAGLV